MPLNIKDETTDRLARELARETGETITVAARIAIEERLKRIRAQARSSDRDTIEAIIARARAAPVRDSRSDDEILGYDDAGLPRR